MVRVHPSPPGEFGRLFFAKAETGVTSGSSSVGRASAFQAEGREFEPRLPLMGRDSSVGRAHAW